MRPCGRNPRGKPCGAATAAHRPNAPAARRQDSSIHPAWSIVLAAFCPAELPVLSSDTFHGSGGISSATGGSGSWSGSLSSYDSRGNKRQRTRTAAGQQRSCHMPGMAAPLAGGQHTQSDLPFPAPAFVPPAWAQLRLPLPPPRLPPQQVAAAQPGSAWAELPPAWQPVQQQQAAVRQPWPPAEQQQTVWCSLHMNQALQHQQLRQQQLHQQRQEQQQRLGGMPPPQMLQAQPALRAVRTRPERRPATEQQLQPQQIMPALPTNLVSQSLPLPAPAPAPAWLAEKLTAPIPQLQTLVNAAPDVPARSPACSLMQLLRPASPSSPASCHLLAGQASRSC